MLKCTKCGSTEVGPVLIGKHMEVGCKRCKRHEEWNTGMFRTVEEKKEGGE